MFPPKRVLAAIDFSEPSRVALVMAARLAAHSDAVLHVLHANDPLLSAAARMQGIELRLQAQEELEHFLAASALPPSVPRRHHVVAGPATEVICNIACRENADVVVIGARGMSRAERLMFGSTAEGVLRRSAAPVLLVPETWVPASQASRDLSGTGPVIAAIDFTAGSFEAMGAAFRFARALHTSLQLLHVVPALPVIERWKTHAAGAAGAQADYARHELARLARGLSMGTPVDTRVETGSVAETIAAVAHECPSGHSVLVVGRRLPHNQGDAPGAIAVRVVSLARVPTLMFMEREAFD